MIPRPQYNNAMGLNTYILTIEPRFKHVNQEPLRREFVDPSKAETAFKELCDFHNLEWSEQMDGSFTTVGMSDIEITLEISES